MGPLITLHAVESMIRAIERAVADGGKLLTGGKHAPTSAPASSNRQSSACQRRAKSCASETFAPIP
jgi:acyl-CoA reductase-like NAD-dependent aldehyde dehydrogenase